METFPPLCFALIVGHDGTSMRLDTGKSMIQKGDIIIRLLKGLRSDGVSMTWTLGDVGYVITY